MTEAAPAAPEVSGAPIEQAQQAPNPAETGNPAKQEPEAQRGQPPSGEERKSLDDIIKNAHEKATEKADDKEKGKEQPKEPVKAKEDAPKAEKDAKAKAEPEKEPPKTTPEKGPDGKFVAKDKPQAAQEQPQEPAQAQQRPAHHEAPSRFDDAAKAEWEGVPESVKGAVHRSIKELEGGFQKYKADAEAFGELKEFDGLAKQNGTTLKQGFSNYVNLEMKLRSDDQQTKMAALQHVFQVAGVNPRELAAHIMGQTPDQVGAEQHRQIQTLHERNNAMTRELNQLRSQVGEYQQKEVSRIGGEYPRFEELRSKMGRLVQSGLVDGDDEPTIVKNAYELADRLYPATSPNGAQNGAHTANNPGSLTPTPQPEPANPAGQKSISGAPASGSDPALPAKRKDQNVSIDDAIKRASARLAS